MSYTKCLKDEIEILKAQLYKKNIQLEAAKAGWEAMRVLYSQECAKNDKLKAEGSSELIASERAANAVLTKENELLRMGAKGDYDLDAWLDWADERSNLLAENMRLQNQLKTMTTLAIVA